MDINVDLKLDPSNAWMAAIVKTVAAARELVKQLVIAEPPFNFVVSKDGVSLAGKQQSGAWGEKSKKSVTVTLKM